MVSLSVCMKHKIIMKKEAINVKKSKRGYWEALEEGKGRGRLTAELRKGDRYKKSYRRIHRRLRQMGAD